MERGFRRNSLQRPLGGVTTITRQICVSRHNESRHNELPPVPLANRSRLNRNAEVAK
jgi:hypothetical protein